MALSPDVSWREEHGSAALNRKFQGILPTGVYKGFELMDMGDGTVQVDTVDSIAVVESDEFSVTVRGDGESELFTIPPGQWIIAIQADYQVGASTSAHFVLVESLLDNQIGVGQVNNLNGRLTVNSIARINIQGKTTVDFGILSIDLGEIGVNRGGRTLDLGRI